MLDVVVTGTGLVTPAGLGAAALLKAIELGQRFYKPGDEAWSLARTPRELVRFPDRPEWAQAREFAGFGSLLALTAGEQALAEANVSGSSLDTERGATVAVAADDWSEQSRFDAALHGARSPAHEAQALFEGLDDHFLLRTFRWGISYGIGALSGFSGASVGIDCPNYAGLTGLRHALDLIQSGEADAALLVGVDTIPRSDVARAILAAMPASEPLLGEGAAALLLERRSAAQARGAGALARIVDCELVACESRERAIAWAERRRSVGVWADVEARASVTGILPNCGALVDVCLVCAAFAQGGSDAARGVCAIEGLWAAGAGVAELGPAHGARV